VSYLAIESSGGSGAGSGGAGGAGGIASGRLHMTPGRVAALTIGVPIVLAMIGWLSLTLVALLDMESFPVNVTIPVAGKQLTAQIDGNVTVRQQAGVSNGKLTGIAKYNLIRPSVTTSRTATGWRVGYRCDIGVGDCTLNGTLVVPSQASLSLDTAGGDVSMASYTGMLTLDLAGGNLNAGTLTGSQIQVKSYGGDVTVNTLDAPVLLDTDGGNINIQAVTSPAGGTVRSYGGDVTMTFTKVPGGLEIDSYGGNVQLTLPGHHYLYDVHTDGGSQHIPSSADGAQDRITVNSDGGDVSITEAS